MSAAEYLDRVEAAAEGGPDLYWDIERSLVHLSVDEYQRRMTMLIKTAAALRAVLSLCDANAEADAGGLREWGEVSIVQVRRTITAALDSAS